MGQHTAKIACHENQNQVREVDDTIYLEPITEIQIHNEIRRLKNKLSLDHMGFSNRFLKIVPPTISSSLCDQLNKIIENGVYPECQTLSRAIPINKEGPLSDPNNYRPISLIPLFGKNFEKLLHSRFMSFLIKNDLLSNKQLDFISKRSTIDALVDVVERI